MAGLAPIPAATRKTLLEWIEQDDGDKTDTTVPTCSTQIQALHARIPLAFGNDRDKRSEVLQPPVSLRLAPLG